MCTHTITYSRASFFFFIFPGRLCRRAPGSHVQPGGDHPPPGAEEGRHQRHRRGRSCRVVIGHSQCGRLIGHAGPCQVNQLLFCYFGIVWYVVTGYRLQVCVCVYGQVQLVTFGRIYSCLHAAAVISFISNIIVVTIIIIIVTIFTIIAIMINVAILLLLSLLLQGGVVVVIVVVVIIVT